MTPRGLDRFRDHFRAHQDSYILIGGTACAVQFEQNGSSFRNTKDFDILVLTTDGQFPFLQAMSSFIVAGGYQHQIDAQGRRRCYRFIEPHDDTWPGKIELCARNSLTEDTAKRYFPLARPADGPDIISLSAILFDDLYVNWLVGGAESQNDVRVARMEFLLPLKALAWKNLTAAKNRGDQVNGDDIRKHKLDCFRLINLIPTTLRITLPPPIASDLADFVQAMDREPPGLPPELNKIGPARLLAAMRTVYSVQT